MRKTEIKRIDFSKCRYANEIHAEIKNALNFPEHYGENLDALFFDRGAELLKGFKYKIMS